MELVPMNDLRVIVHGEILAAEEFDSPHPLFVQYLFDLPNGWIQETTSKNQWIGMTQSSLANDDRVAHFSHPFTTQFLFSVDSDPNAESFAYPLLLISVLGSDGLSIRDEGYGFESVPMTPGRHTLSLRTWKLSHRNTIDKKKNVFLDLNPSIEDIKVVSIPRSGVTDCGPLSRFGLKTEGSGRLKIRVHVIHQSGNRKFGLQDQKIRILEKMNSDTILRSVQTVIEAFQRARRQVAVMKI